MADGNVVVGVFTERQQAEQALFELRQARFHDIGWILREDDDPTTQKLPALSTTSERSTVLVGLLLGAIVGGLVGGTVLLLSRQEHLVWLVTFLTLFVLSGAFLGGGIGFWIRIGIEEAPVFSPSSPSSLYRIILIVQADDRSALVFRIFERCQALSPSLDQQVVTETLAVPERDVEATLKLKTLEDTL